MRRVIASLVGAAVLTAAVAGCAANSGRRTDGPLVTGGGREAFVVLATPGKVFTDGAALIDLDGSQPATIVNVESLGGDPALTFLGARVAGPRRRYTTSTTFTGWPPHGLRPRLVESAIGRSVKPIEDTTRQQGYELLLGYRVGHDSARLSTGHGHARP